ncbi:hypothetical protein Tco_0369722 [Tanacetum coccineum]
MSARDKTGLGYGTQLNEMSNNSETDSEISLSVFDVRSSDEESTPANDRFSKADGFHAVPPPITGNFLTPRADISFADDEDDVSEVQTVSPVKTNETQTVKTRVDKIDQTSQKQGIGFKKIKACFVCKSTDHLIKDCNFHDKQSQEPKMKTVVNTGPRVDKPVWDNTKRVNHQKISKYPHLRKTFVPTGVLTRTGLITPVKQNEKRAVHKVSTARPVSTVRPFAPKIAQTSGAIRPIYPRMDNVRPRGSYSPIKRSYYTKPDFRPKDLKQDVKTFGVQNMTTAGTKGVVNTGKDSGSFMLKKGNPEILLQDHAVVDSGCSSHMTGNKAYLSDYEDYNGGFVVFGSDPKGGKIMGKDSTAIKSLKKISPRMSAKSKIINNVRYITAKVAGKPMNISEASIRSDLLFDDADRTDSLHNQAIFDAIKLMGYEGDLTVLTFNKALFSPQWRFLFHNMNHCISSKSTSWDQIPTNIATAVICLATNQKYNFSKLIFDGMMRHLDAKKKFVMYPRFIPVFLTNQLKNVPVPLDHFPINALTTNVFSFMVKKDKSFFGNVTPLFPSMLAQPTEDEGARLLAGIMEVTTQAAQIKDLKYQIKQRKKKLKPGRKFAKSTPTAHTDQIFDDVDVNDAMDYMETMLTCKSTAKPKEVEVSTDKLDEGTAEPKDGTSYESTALTIVFRDDETIAEFLVSISQNKAKQKGVEIKDAEDSDRPRATSTRSVLTLKPLPKIDPKDKGKKVLEEEAESDVELEGVDEAERKFDQLTKDEEIARKVEESKEVPCSTKRYCNQKQTTNKNSAKKPNDDLSEACRRKEAC